MAATPPVSAHSLTTKSFTAHARTPEGLAGRGRFSQEAPLFQVASTCHQLSFPVAEHPSFLEGLQSCSFH